MLYKGFSKTKFSILIVKKWPPTVSPLVSWFQEKVHAALRCLLYSMLALSRSHCNAENSSIVLMLH